MIINNNKNYFVIICTIILFAIIGLVGCGNNKSASSSETKVAITLDKCFDEVRGLPRPDLILPDKFKLLSSEKDHEIGAYAFETTDKIEKENTLDQYPVLKEYLEIIDDNGYIFDSAPEFDNVNAVYIVDTKDNEIKALLFFAKGDSSNLQVGFMFSGVDTMNESRNKRLGNKK